MWVRNKEKFMLKDMLKNILNSHDSFYDSGIGLIFQKLFVTFMLWPYYSLFFKMKVYGKENIPKNTGMIIAPNHQSHHDPPLIAAATGMHMAFMAKKELFDVPVLSGLISGLGAFPVNREKPELKTIKTAKRIMASKRWNLCIFPQGTRVMDGTLGDVKAGFSKIAKATKAIVVPVYIDMEKGKYPFYGTVKVTIAKPMPPSLPADEILERWKESIAEMAGIEYNRPEPSENEPATSA